MSYLAVRDIFKSESLAVRDIFTGENTNISKFDCPNSNVLFRQKVIISINTKTITVMKLCLLRG